ncbi:MFS transporter [Virgibacillus salinus]|uniref:MFS-type transporter involved in bile tolerance, Atg22 family n=1 Tax=Virgibacillus salinus TaxID=553311 RepID=A0A1H0XTF0_9BACI|nr:MFS transporter [Virgibacillus salinus]SDQ06129.1 MFS-type transporter involved in bile tolerance, Atg22 family [Virgibacillus salinus]
MNIRKIADTWKYPSIILFSIGISNIGAWVYFLALNLIVFNMTGSPLAVAVLYIINPLATLFTNLWGGSVIDRINKKHLMVALDIIQGTLLACLAYFTNTLWIIYLLVFFINMASSVYGPTSVSYITRLIPTEQRQRFNSLRSLLDSGAFILGPAITGVLFMIGTPIYAIVINAIAFFFSALVTLFMPNVEKRRVRKSSNLRLSLSLLKQDWKEVLQFSRKFLYVMTVYFLFSAFIVMQTAIDSLEVAFSKEVISLSDGEYGFLVSIAGAGILVGSLMNVLFTKKLAVSLLIGIGSVMVSVGYIIFAFSNNFLIASVGVFILAFSLAFANTGFYTFYQNNIPVEVMGRVGSIYDFVEALLVIVITSIFAVTSQLISIQFVVVFGAIFMFLLTLALLLFSIQPSKSKYYRATLEEVKETI